jgi:hypothetical protein
MSEKCHHRTHAPQQSVFYSITSAARASMVGEMVKPRFGIDIDHQLQFGQMPH